MKRSIVLELTPDEVLRAIVEFARNKYYDQPDYDADSGIGVAKPNDVTLSVETVFGEFVGDCPEADRLVVSAKVEISHSFDPSSS